MLSALLLLATVTTQAQNSGLFRGADHIKITRGNNLVFSFDSLGFRNAQGQRLMDSLANVIMNRVRDSANVLMTTGPRKLTQSLVNAVGVTNGYVLTAATGVATWSAPVTGGWNVDSAAALMTVGPRKLTESLIKPGATGALLVTNGTTTFWQLNPPLPSGRSIFMYSTSITSNNAADTASDKHIFYITQLHREYPIAHATDYYSFDADFYIREGTVYGSYSATITYTGGHSAASFVAGDKIILRFFPGGGATDKYVKLYRIPAGYHVMGAGAATDIYGEYVGHWIIPGANFPASGYVNIDCTLSYKAK